VERKGHTGEVFFDESLKVMYIHVCLSSMCT